MKMKVRSRNSPCCQLGMTTPDALCATSGASNSLWDRRQAFCTKPEQPGTATPLESTCVPQPQPVGCAVYSAPPVRHLASVNTPLTKATPTTGQSFPCWLCLLCPTRTQLSTASPALCQQKLEHSTQALVLPGSKGEFLFPPKSPPPARLAHCRVSALCNTE